MAADLRLKGQEVVLRIVEGGVLVNEINSIGSFNDNTAFTITEDGFLGEPVNRFDEVLDGYGGDFEMQVNTPLWHNLQEDIARRARRELPNLVFNIVRTDFYANGQTAIITYTDVKFGPQPTSIASRKDFVKVRMEFRCSERAVQVNAI
jgi:hypothetical protein